MALKRTTPESKDGDEIKAQDTQAASPDTQAATPTPDTPAPTPDTPAPTPKAVAKLEDQQDQEVAEAKGQDPKSVQTRVRVENLRGVAQRQPSTGTWVPSKGEAYLVKDGWLDNQVKAKLLKILE